jgi:apoptosis-inducing factor 2
VARELDPYCRVTLIDRRELFFNVIGAVRAVVERGFEKTLWLNYKKVLLNGTFIQGEVTSMTATSVSLRLAGTGATQTIDGIAYIVIATGSMYALPMMAPATSSAETCSQFQSIQDAVHRSKSVVVVGGGPTAVETAGRFRSVFAAEADSRVC